MDNLDKDKLLKNVNKSSSVDAKVNEKQSDNASNNADSGKHSNNNEPTNVSSANDTSSSSNNSNNFSIDLALLNELSKVCQLAMSNISFLCSRISDLNMKKELVSIYSQYSNILSQINQHFKKYGEVPDCIPMHYKVMGLCGVKMNTMKDKSNSHVADIMIQGTLMGIIKCQKILNSDFDIEKSTKQLLKDFNKFQRENMDKLNAYL